MLLAPLMMSALAKVKQKRRTPPASPAAAWPTLLDGDGAELSGSLTKAFFSL